MSLREEFRSFLDRPNGGMEVEVVYGLAELGFGASLLASVNTLQHVPTLREFFWTTPHGYLALPFLASAAATFTGLLFYRGGNPICAPLRWAGACLSSLIWSWMAFKSISLSGAEAAGLWFYLIGAVWQWRIMVSAWRRRQCWLSHA